jgi:hypothetical protein
MSQTSWSSDDRIRMRIAQDIRLRRVRVARNTRVDRHLVRVKWDLGTYTHSRVNIVSNIGQEREKEDGQERNILGIPMIDEEEGPEEIDVSKSPDFRRGRSPGPALRNPP